ncbi:type II toxin-antitoxin system VapC family toxin [Desmonostoc muscorum CCALA 125]|nr:type II toxin-antitoxin system VapC family toxin [Desmonostoc muscorum CCALA 125]
MIAVDTNIVVRLLTQDDEFQYQKSLEIFQNHQIFISDTVILETEWVLRFAYKFKPEAICAALGMLFGLVNVHLTNASLIAQVLLWHEAGLDFADAFHLAQAQNYTHLYTFDEKFVKRSQGLTTWEVTIP